jgi:hypothetical protein
MWLLGHAVADATETVSPNTTPAVTAPADTGTTGTGTTGTGTTGTGTTGSGTTNSGTGTDTATAPTTPTATPPATTPTQLYEGDASKPINTITVVTAPVAAAQAADGGPIDTSGNTAVEPNAATQSAASANKASQTSTGTGGDNKDGDKGGSQSSSSNQSTGSDPSGTNQGSSSSNNGNNGDKNVADSGNDNSTTITGGNVSGGNGGSNSVDINTGLINTTFNCPPQSTCVYNITTGNVTVTQEANGGSVTNSGNVNIGTKPPAPTPPPSPPVVKTVAKKAPVKVLSSAQPTSALATTGAETSTPLTVGLIALGAGTALTLAGRRRREVQTA